jgi:hypothetical protein
MPIDMTMEEPGTRIVGEEPDGDVIPSITGTHNISNDGIVEVVGRVSGATDHIEVVSMQMNRVLFSSNHQDGDISTIICKHSQGRRWQRQEL